MNREEIKEIIRITIEEICEKNNHELENMRYNMHKREVERRLNDYFQGRGDGNNISYALKLLEKDRYIGIVYMQYHERKTIEQIAEIWEKRSEQSLKIKRE